MSIYIYLFTGLACIVPLLPSMVRENMVNRLAASRASILRKDCQFGGGTVARGELFILEG